MEFRSKISRNRWEEGRQWLVLPISDVDVVPKILTLLISKWRFRVSFCINVFILAARQKDNTMISRFDTSFLKSGKSEIFYCLSWVMENLYYFKFIHYPLCNCFIFLFCSRGKKFVILVRMGAYRMC